MKAQNIPDIDLSTLNNEQLADLPVCPVLKKEENQELLAWLQKECKLDNYRVYTEDDQTVWDDVGAQDPIALEHCEKWIMGKGEEEVVL